MNWRVMLLSLYLPGSMKRRQLLELVRRSAEAFGCAPELEQQGFTGRRSHRQLLEAYAVFTGEQARLAMAGGISPDILSERLRRESKEMGKNLRRILRLRTNREFRAALRLIYSALAIDLRASACGEVLIKKCFFSRFYSEPVCRLISALDDGLIEGLSGGGRLCFTQCLTAGASQCRGFITMPKQCF